MTNFGSKVAENIDYIKVSEGWTLLIFRPAYHRRKYLLSWDSFLADSFSFCWLGKNLLISAEAAGVVVLDENEAGLTGVVVATVEDWL